MSDEIKECPNCGNEACDEYCPNCGEKMGEIGCYESD
jgi:rRNA maturation protein Nop10